MNLSSKMFLVVMCRHCGNYQTTQSKKTLKCMRCGRTSQIKDLKIFYRTLDGDDASRHIQKLKESNFFKKDNTGGDFHTYSRK